MAVTRRSKFRTPMLALALVLVFLTAATALTWVEGESKDGNIKGVGDAVWYGIVTLTTVGYGDRYPTTVSGRIIGLVFLLGSVGVLGIMLARVSEFVVERRERRRMGFQGTDMAGHVVIVGWTGIARAVTRQLLNAERKIAIVTNRRDDVELIHQEFHDQPVFALLAPLENVEQYAKAGIEQSSMVFVNLGDDTKNLITILNAKAVYPDTKYVVILENADLRATFEHAGVTYIVSSNDMASRLLGSYLFEPDVADLSVELLTATASKDDYDIQQYLVNDTNPYVGKTFGTLLADLRQHHYGLPIAISRKQTDGRDLMKLPEDGVVLMRGDYVIVITDGAGERKLRELFGVREGI